MLYFIVNPNAGRENGYKVWKRLERRLNRKQAEYQMILTGGPGEAKSIAAQLTSFDFGEQDSGQEELIIVGVGGDGIMNEITDGAHLSERLMLGYIPVSPGTDLARGLRLPRRPEACLDRILTMSEIRWMDYGVIDYGADEPLHRRFLVSSGCGFEACFTDELRAHEEQDRVMGVPLIRNAAEKAVYMNCLRNMQTVRGYILLDNARRIELNHIYLLSALIQPTESGRKLAVGSSNCDGLLSVAVLHNRSRIRQFSVLAASGFRNTANDAGVRVYSCREVKVSLEEPMLLHADGEACGLHSEFVIRCVKQKLRIIC